MSPTTNALIVGTLSLGSLYAVIGLGLNIVFKSTGVINFAQGAFIVLGGFLYTSVLKWTGNSTGLGLTGTMVIAFVVGVITYLVVMRRMRGADPWILVIVTFGLATVIETVVSLIWGTTVLYIHVGTQVYVVAGLRFSLLDVIAVSSALISATVLSLGMRFTRWGVATRAVAENVLLASQWGVRVDLVSASAWGIAAAIGALTGVVYGAQTSVSGGLGDIGLAAFPGMMLGGMGSLPGSLIGGLIVGGLVTWVTIKQDPQVATLAAYGLLIVVLLLIPHGLFGQREFRRV